MTYPTCIILHVAVYLKPIAEDGDPHCFFHKSNTGLNH